jgi:hypothetical protein
MPGVFRNRRDKQRKSINEIGKERRENADGGETHPLDDVEGEVVPLTDEGRAAKEAVEKQDDDPVLDISDELRASRENQTTAKEAREQAEPRTMTVDDISLSPGGERERRENDDAETVTKEAQVSPGVRDELRELRERVKEIDDEDAEDDFQQIRALIEASEWDEAAERLDEFTQWVMAQAATDASEETTKEIERYALANDIDLTASAGGR